jgi:hypothetical protein
MDLSLLLLLAIGVLVWLERAERTGQGCPPHAQPTPGENQKDAPPAKPVRFINVEGTRHFGAAAAGFIRRFGLTQRNFEDACALDGPLDSPDSLPTDVRNALLALYETGNVRGPDVTRFIHGTRPITRSESLYLVLYEPGTVSNDVVAFVDTTR